MRRTMLYKAKNSVTLSMVSLDYAEEQKNKDHKSDYCGRYTYNISACVWQLGAEHKYPVKRIGQYLAQYLQQDAYKSQPEKTVWELFCHCSVEPRSNHRKWERCRNVIRLQQTVQLGLCRCFLVSTQRFRRDHKERCRSTTYNSCIMISTTVTRTFVQLLRWGTRLYPLVRLFGMESGQFEVTLETDWECWDWHVKEAIKCELRSRRHRIDELLWKHFLQTVRRQFFPTFCAFPPMKQAYVVNTSSTCTRQTI